MEKTLQKMKTYKAILDILPKVGKEIESYAQKEKGWLSFVEYCEEFAVELEKTPQAKEKETRRPCN